ncbi:TonB-dependent receptor domain-containing protein [Steroidobacter flavus]|uniref:TonB-dependent receptor domain-containing protein n=1 Tax=Steroidobacter flavus TaxID=1842136 RepID=A0ABV8SXJ6_9GAMM
MRTSIIAAAVCCALASFASANDAAAAIRRATKIEPQSLGSALKQLAETRDLQLLYFADAVKNLRTAGAVGEITVDEALTRILDGTGLHFRYLNDNTITIFSENAAEDPLGGDDRASASELEEIVVTGTHINGVKDTFSPVVTMDRESLERAGFTTVFEALDKLPQNFGGGATPDTSTSGDARGTGAASVNLRGLGDGATLILLNGHRLAPGGAFGDFVDISTIPTAAIDRIEVVTDGASAIYGSDAVAGVVNIILRKDFEGAESRLNWSTVTDGGSDTLRAGQTVGWSGERAHGLISYEYADEAMLPAHDKDFARTLPDRNYLLPESRKHNVLVSGGATLSDRISLSADGYFGKRRSRGSYTWDNSAFGYTSDLDVDQLSGSLGLNAKLFSDWQANLSGAFSKSRYHGDDLTSAAPVNGGSLAVSSGEVLSFDASLGGSLFRLSSEAVRGVIGLQYRDEQIDQSTVDRLNHSIVYIDRDERRQVLAAYGEIYAPIVTSADGVPGMDRLALTLAGRYEDYSDVGTAFNPKVGLAWSPVAGFSLRGTYGTSFRAPRLDQLIDKVQYAYLAPYADPQSATGQSTALVIGGSQPNLDPEEAETWSVGFDFTPPSLPGLSVRASYFDIDYEDRVSIPSLSMNRQYQYTQFSGVPQYDPSQALVQSLVSRARIYRDFSTLFPIAPLSLADVTVLLDSRQQNMSVSTVQGVDLDVQYELQTSFGGWTFFANGSYLTDFSEQVSPQAAVTELLNTYDNPVDLRVRAGAAWRTARATAALYLNYVDDYWDDEAAPVPVKIASWTTMDVSVRFNLGEFFGTDLARNAFVTVNINNVLNEDPPTLGSAPVRGLSTVYDAANADPAGRRIGILLSKQW